MRVGLSYSRPSRASSGAPWKLKASRRKPRNGPMESTFQNLPGGRLPPACCLILSSLSACDTQEHAMDIKTVAFIGLGVMGEAMCRNLARKGSWRVIGYDTRQEPMLRLQADGVTSAGSRTDAVAEAEVVLMCLPGGKEVEAVAR